MTPDLIGRLIIYIVVLLFAISAHEAAHAWMSNKFGDDTARLLGRITLNPVAHTDPIGTLLIPIVAFILSATGAGFIPLIGWGKPTPVNPSRWRNPKLANVMVSGAGIAANTLTAICALIIINVLAQTGSFGTGGALGSMATPVFSLLLMTLIMNASLAVFNLLPFPPLDGSKILETFLPPGFRPLLSVLEQYGYLILLAAIYFGLFDLIFRPVWYLISYLLYL